MKMITKMMISDKNSKHTKETDTDADAFRNKERREEHKDNAQNDPDDGTIPPGYPGGLLSHDEKSQMRYR
ncbi:MAG: hypothetical protein M0C28_47300 [Candidatus Moduliflexus flocculans]|nr:hypothetical protein [Candidatus Moduliflexus flocculans]